MVSTIPLYFEAGLEQVFALLSLPALGTPLRSSVLICSPWGWDEVASYRSRRRWAETLAAAGHPTLRFSRPGTGDSRGAPGDPDRAEAWVAALTAAAENLRESYPQRRVAALGLGLGGVLAREAAGRGAPIDDLVLWGSPASGRAFVREITAFSGMQDWAGEETGLPEGWIEAGGFVISAETAAALRQLPAAAGSRSRLTRALLLDRDGAAPATAVTEWLNAAGAVVTNGSGAGWGDFVSHPERTTLPEEVAGAVETWLHEGEAGDAPTAVEPSAPAWGRDELELDTGGAAVRESPLSVEQDFGSAFGVLAEPTEAGAGLCAVFLNAGAVPHVGPNRLWVETARRWAGRGVPSLRVDLEGIGEAGGDEQRLREVSEFYTDRYDPQVARLLDVLQARGLGDRFLLVGLCAGGFWSYRAALRDPRVTGAVLLNAGALRWHENILQEREARKIGQAREWGRWRKLLRGEISRERLLSFLHSLFSRSSWRRETDAGFATELDQLRDKGVHLSLAFSGREPLHAELQREGVISQLERWPNVALHELPGSDHTLRPLAAQRGARELLDEQLSLALRFVGSTSA
ncbi:MAG TPA: alpha/beta hydrolase [Solirubrobacterales bacterium]|nr:alpha/beta hydrolase [Solirubrobacterales bacterium]